MSTCPHCQQAATDAWKKAFASPLAPMPCQRCGAEVTVTWKHYLLAIAPGSLLFLAGYLLFEESSWQQYAMFGAGFVLMLGAQILAMPFSPGAETAAASAANDDGDASDSSNDDK